MTLDEDGSDEAVQFIGGLLEVHTTYLDMSVDNVVQRPELTTQVGDGKKGNSPSIPYTLAFLSFRRIFFKGINLVANLKTDNITVGKVTL